MSEARCPVCGSEIAAGDLFCADCGARLASSSGQENRERDVMTPEEQENESDRAQEGYESRAQTPWSSEEKVDEEQEAGPARADYSEVVTVSFTNEHIEQSLDLFLDTITPLSSEPLESMAIDPYPIIESSTLLQAAATGESEVDASAIEPDQYATDEETEDRMAAVVVGDRREEQTRTNRAEMDAEKAAATIGEIEQADIDAEEDHEKYVTEWNSVDDTDRTGEWKSYTNGWYGFALELPSAWQVSTQNGVTKVASSLEGKQGLDHALVKLVYLPKSISAQDVAPAWVSVLRETWTSLEVHMLPAHSLGKGNEQLIHIEGMLAQAHMRGTFVVQVFDQFALISGFQVRAEHMQRVQPIFRRVLSSFAFIKKVRRRRYIDEDEHAYTGYVPVDWAVQAHLRRIPTAERTPLVDFQASDPIKMGNVAIPPTYELYSEDALMTREDVVGYRKVMPSTRFIEELLIPRYQARKAHMHVERVHSYPERSQERNRKQGQGGTIFDVAAVQYTYDEAEKTFREQIVLQIMHTPVIATWTVQMVSRRRAPVEHFESLEPFFAGILETRHMSEAWKHQERARVEKRLWEAQRSLASASAGYMQAMYALSGSAKSITENLRERIGLAREADAQTRQDEIVPLLHDTTMCNDASLSYDLPVGFQMYWQHAPANSLEAYEHSYNG